MRGGLTTEGSAAGLLAAHAVKGPLHAPRHGFERGAGRTAAGHGSPRCRGAHSAIVSAIGRDFSPVGDSAGSEFSDVGAGEDDVLEWRHDFNERFLVGDVIGEGNQGLVRKAVDRETGNVAAVKVLARVAGAGGMSAVEEKKVRSEARFLRRLQSCPAVARMFGAYEDDEHVYIVMEQLDAGSMADGLEEAGRFSEREAAELMSAVFGFLAHSHDQGIFYGDVKPANFMLGSSPCQDCRHHCSSGRLRGLAVKAIDFGTCQQRIPGIHFRKMAGSPMYMAPEVRLGRYDVEADLWSAGVMLFQLLSGRLPFAKYDDTGELTDAGRHLGFSFEGDLWAGVSAEAKDLITKLLVRIPTQRISARASLDHSWFQKALGPEESYVVGKETSSIVVAPKMRSVAAKVEPL
ncbi:unnamed protein product [Ostreobium quekettii]|uniref:Protein kinase domain-containing protein n=1 Tax=Ostreobium quekettii TaxID=121088 RepID=A0A8S1IPI6_9CHLO|nr:unnamed protein product [Ostreobium quekettii]|eukprot:evm.model.scf_3134.3 EVM.evm.TU.scf_3134.3   scf_3134:13222-14880(-)